MNPENIHILNVVLGIGTIIAQIVSVLALLLLFLGPKKNGFLDFISKHFLPIGFFISASAWLVLIYSEIIHFLPCYLCWWQRVFMFPLALMFGIALWDKDKKVIRYSLPLLCAGFAISVYQNFIYYFGESANIPCDASGVSCYKQYVYEFGGYISIPMLALSGFFVMLVLLSVAHFYKREN